MSQYRQLTVRLDCERTHCQRAQSFCARPYFTEVESSIRIAPRQFAAALGPLREAGTIPPPAQSLNQQNGAGQAPAQDVDGRDFVTERSTLRNGHFQITGDAALIALNGKFE